MNRRAFEELVGAALAMIPDAFRSRLDNVEIVVEDSPSPDLLREMGLAHDEPLFGLYQGTPLTERSWAHGNTLPDRIVIYQRPIEEACDSEDEMFDEVCLTIIHEAGHFFGLSEEEIQAIEDEFWYGDDGAVPPGESRDG